MLITTRTVQSIEKELLERLKRGVYGDIYNYPVKEYNKVLDMEGLQAASEDEDEEVRFWNYFFHIIVPKMIVCKRDNALCLDTLRQDYLEFAKPKPNLLIPTQTR